MTKTTKLDGQRDLFIKGDKICKCEKTTHALTEADYRHSLLQLNRIKQLIIDHGWNLTYTYYYYLDKMSYDCNAWVMANTDYLLLRGSFFKELEDATIPLERKRYY